MTSTPTLFLSSLHHRHYTSHKTIKIKSLPHNVLCYVVRGEGTLQIDDTSHPIKPQQLYFFIEGMHIEAFLQSDDCEYYLLFVDCLGVNKKSGTVRLLSPPYTELLPLTVGMVPLMNAPAVHERIHQLYISINKSVPNSLSNKASNSFELNAQFQELLHVIILSILTLSKLKEADTGIEESIAYIHKHYHHKIQLKTLAEMSGFTPTSYSREFKKRYGKSPIEYLNAHRIAQAKQMLLVQNHSIKEVAASSGFISEFYFSRMFKRETGFSPTLYMKRTDIRIAVTSCFRFEDILQSLGIEPVVSTNCHKRKTMNEEEHQAWLAKCMEDIRQAEPELIICDHLHQPYFEQLKGIAPTVKFSYSMDWRVVHKQIAEVIGRENEAEHNIKRLERKLTHARSALRQRFGNETVTLMRVMDKLIRIQGANNHPLNDLIYSDLGLKPGYCVPTTIMNIEFSPDKFPNLGTDHLFIQSQFYYPADEIVFRNIQALPEWNSIKAVTCNHTHYTDNWAAMSWSPTGRIGILDALMNV
ncbi:helix-turn-helix domain-containing protein [Paenibacillus eucommiae]|uniref:AraC-like DNA-binding protein n=1 Tax=Paenibacillus eucommiae TaxID=1355755 RepID=A0ABS4J1J1_9BACL|nr:helix-turn-helix domain-containing protein [Paenibacillus eucommiae]MBP1993673.1 AraC-like DNA-binding protein [Paenibacillus eucommiae]